MASAFATMNGTDENHDPNAVAQHEEHDAGDVDATTNVTAASNRSRSRSRRFSQNLSPADRQTIRRKYRNLMDNVISKFNDLDCTQIDSNEFVQAMTKADKLFQHVDTPQEAILDGIAFKHLSKLTRNQVEEISTSSQKFTATDFADKLKLFLFESYTVDDNHQRRSGDPQERNVDPEGFAVPSSSNAPSGDRDPEQIQPQHFAMLGRSVQANFPFAPTYKYLLGSFEKNPELVEAKVRKPRRKENAEGGPGTATQTFRGDGTDGEVPENGAALTEQLVESTYRQLVHEYRDNDNFAISYLDFVVDPESFGHTVENMFHVSFLVKENKARIAFEGGKDDVTALGLPVIRPLRSRAHASKKKDQEDLAERKQVIVSLTMEEWEQYVQKRRLKKAMINHDAIKRGLQNNDGAEASGSRDMGGKKRKT